MKLTLMIMAAGMGSRYGGLKQLDPVGPGGEIIMDYSVFDALRAGFHRVVFVIRRSIEQDFRRAIGSRFEKRLETVYAFQELDSLPAGFAVPAERQKPWGTGHAMLVGRDLVPGPFAVINADDFYGAGAFQLLADYLRSAAARGREYAMVGYTLRDTLSDHGTVTRGICECDDRLYLRRIVETAQLARDGQRAVSIDVQGARHSFTGDEWVSMNAWAFTPTIFDHLDREFRVFLETRRADPKAEFFIPGVVGRLIEEQRARVRILPGASRWFGITYRNDKPFLESALKEMAAQGAYPARLWS
ncbi:MAG TPA: nucleotidyltransferase [Kiritimatiellia bacterium]|nr:nucleotidyltransferase [Kiritimatiellia bacterium]HRZ13027.1 nucleotidyltransferase [Kiritimatiellia bacterium]HSA18363.1 nucleotidyltransferase [Kiritimatiellia bacterium]